MNWYILLLALAIIVAVVLIKRRKKKTPNEILGFLEAALVSVNSRLRSSVVYEGSPDHARLLRHKRDIEKELPHARHVAHEYNVHRLMAESHLLERDIAEARSGKRDPAPLIARKQAVEEELAQVMKIIPANPTS